MAHVAEELANQDDAEEDCPRREHDEDDVPAFLRRGFLRGEQDRCGKRAHPGRILLHSLGMEGKGPAASLVAPLGAAVERRDRRGPGLAVAGKALHS